MNRNTKGYTRREFIGVAAGGAAAISLVGLISACAGQDGKRPNVLVLQPDQHRGTIMSCAGDKQIHTPNLDRLAAAGVRFTNCVSSSPVCSPFRASFQTGLYQHKHGVVRNNLLLDPDFTTFAEVFATAGYATGYIGKWHLDGGIPEVQPGGYIEPGERRQEWQDWNGYEKFHEYFKVWKYDENRNQVRVEGYDWEPTWHTDMALDFARHNRDAGKPWLYYIAYGPPHDPEQCPQKYLDMFDPDAFELPPDILAAEWPPEREKLLRWYYQVYYGLVTAIDVEVGRILDGLRDLGVYEDTIILYTSDHGDRLGSHRDPNQGYPRGKGAPYATAFRIPLIIHWPREIRPGQVYDTLVSNVDFAPTLLDMAGLGVPAVMQGDSIASWCLKGRGIENEAVYLGIGGPPDTRSRGWRGVWDGRYVFSPLGYNVLYDHQADPYEMNNLFDSPEHAAVRRRMCQLLAELAEKTEDPLLPQVREACNI